MSGEELAEFEDFYAPSGPTRCPIPAGSCSEQRSDGTPRSDSRLGEFHAYECQPCHNPERAGAERIVEYASGGTFRVAVEGLPVNVTFEDWTQGRTVPSLGTNAGAPELPFQSWRRFKEAFAPELVARAVAASEIPVSRCLDPFGGSGTTALACQFLGIHPTIVEVNPFLADLIEAKLTAYDTDALARDLGSVLRRAARQDIDRHHTLRGVPATFIEPGVKQHWIFDRVVADRVSALLEAIERLNDEAHRRLFRVLLGGVLIEVSNVVVSGKGRRYRRGWERRPHDPRKVDEQFCDAVQRAIPEIHRYARRACPSYELRRGDCRTILNESIPCELAVFSPPYPNSFDYTDVYNIELWTLGYLTDSRTNQALRLSTLCSHVQLGRAFPTPPSGSTTLTDTLERLEARRAGLWDHRIPAMVGGYFSDIMAVLTRAHRSLARRGSVWMVVGDSRYADVQVRTAEIISELASHADWRLDTVEPCRSMRASAQQGGRPELSETLIVLTKS